MPFPEIIPPLPTHLDMSLDNFLVTCYQCTHAFLGERNACILHYCKGPVLEVQRCGESYQRTSVIEEALPKVFVATTTNYSVVAPGHFNP